MSFNNYRNHIKENKGILHKIDKKVTNYCSSLNELTDQLTD